MGFLDKGFVTDRTLMRSLVCVKHHVFGQNSSCDETFSTLGTDVTLGPVTRTCMNSCNMLCNMRLLSESLLTNGAPVRFLTRMSQQMFLQLRGRDANSRASWMRASMLCSMISPFMHRKLLQCRKSHVTVTAGERFHSHRFFKLGSGRWLGLNWYLMLGPIAIMDCSVFPHVGGNCKRLSTD